MTPAVRCRCQASIGPVQAWVSSSAMYASFALDRAQEIVDGIPEDRRVVLLGESTHGTEEYYRVREAVTKRLVEERGNFHLIKSKRAGPPRQQISGGVFREIACGCRLHRGHFRGGLAGDAGSERVHPQATGLPFPRGDSLPKVDVAQPVHGRLLRVVQEARARSGQCLYTSGDTSIENEDSPVEN